MTKKDAIRLDVVTSRFMVYVAHPLGGDIRGNIQQALGWLRFLMLSEPEVCFVAPWIACVLAGADDGDPVARERGLLDAERVIAECNGLVLAGALISHGMRREEMAARKRNLAICDLTILGLSNAPEPMPGVLKRLSGWPP